MTVTNATKQDTALNTVLLNSSLRLLAPKLIDYRCELSDLIESIEADEDCAEHLLNYARTRVNEPDSQIDTVRHAVVYLGLIDTKQFLFSYLLLNTGLSDRAGLVQCLVRAKITTELFKTNGPLNKDLAFVGAMLTRQPLLKITKPESIFLLFKMPTDVKQAIKNFDYGLRTAIKQAAIIETKCNPASSKREAMPGEFEMMYRDAVYWANGLLKSL